MTALAANADRIVENFGNPSRQEPIVTSAAEVYQGAMIVTIAAGTASPASDAASISHVQGVAQNRVTGDGSLRVRIEGNVDVEFVSSGLTQDDIGKNVAAADDNTIETITASTNKVAAGTLVKLVGTTATVRVGVFGATNT